MTIKIAFIAAIILNSFLLTSAQTNDSNTTDVEKTTGSKYEVPMISVNPDKTKTVLLTAEVPGIACNASVRKNNEGKTSIAVEFTHDQESKAEGTAVLWIKTKAGMFTKVGPIPDPNEQNISAMVTAIELDEFGLLVTMEPDGTEQPKGKIYGAFTPKE